MKRQKLFAGLVTVLALTLFGCGTAAVPQAAPIDLSAIVVTDAAGTPCAEQLKMTVDDTTTLNAALPEAGVTMEAVSSSAALKAVAVGGQLSLTAVDEGVADVTITFSTEGLTPVQRVLHVTVELREQELTAALVPVPEEFGNDSEDTASPIVKATTTDDEEQENPEPTCSYENGVLSVQTGTAAALDLVCEENTVFTFDTDSECIDAVLQDGLLLVTGEKEGTAVVTITGEKDKYKPAVLKLTVNVVLPPIKLTLTAQGQNPKEPIIEIGGTAKITVKAEPAEAVLSATSDNEAVTVLLTKGALTLSGKKEGSAKVTIKAVYEGFAETVQVVPVAVSSKRAKLTLTCPQMGNNNTITLLQGAQTKITAAIGTKAVLTHEATGNAVELTRSGNLFTAKAVNAGTTKLTLLCKDEGLSDNTQTITINVTQPQIVLTTASQSVNIVPGATGTVRYNVNPADAEVTASCDGSLADVACDGGTLTIEPHKVGKGIITLTAKKSGYAASTQTVYLTAGQAPVQLTLGSSYISGTPGEKLTVSCKTTPANAQISTRVSGNAEASYSDGVITVIPSDTGSATITVTASKDGYSDATRTITLAATGHGAQEVDIDISGFADEVFRMVNKERASRGIAALERRYDVEEGANIRAKEIKKKYSHTRPDGSNCDTVLSGISTGGVGENIYYGIVTPKAAMSGWMDSPGHKENILASMYSGIGVGVYSDGKTVYWVQMFVIDPYETPEDCTRCNGCTKQGDSHGCTGDFLSCTCDCNHCTTQRKRAQGLNEDGTVKKCTVCPGCAGGHLPGECTGNRNTCPCPCPVCEPAPVTPPEPKPTPTPEPTPPASTPDTSGEEPEPTPEPTPPASTPDTSGAEAEPTPEPTPPASTPDTSGAEPAP